MKFLTCLLVVAITIVRAVEPPTTILPEGIVNEENNNDKSTDDESVTDVNNGLRLISDVENSPDESSEKSSDELSSESLPKEVSDQRQSASSTEPSYIQTVPKKKSAPPLPTTPTVPQSPRKLLSTLPPIPIMTSPAVLNNTHLLQGWIADEIADALWAFAPQPSSNPKCTLHSQLYRNSINNFTMWAMQMLDSSNRIPSGILTGTVFQLGHFDECIKISLPSEDLHGKYCLPTIRFAPTADVHPSYQHDTNPKFKEPEPYESAYDYFRPNNDNSRRPRDIIHWAVCVPSSCTVDDIHEALTQALVKPLAGHGISVNISLPREKCYAPSEEKPFSTGFYLTLLILGIIYVTVLFATWMDMFYYQNDRPHSQSLRKWLKPFSAYTNIIKLTTGNPNREFSEFHYLKAFAMICIISGHRQMSLHGPTPNENPWWLEWTYSQLLVAFSVNGGVLVDTFFVLSGFLTCHYIYQELIKRKSLNLPIIIINRWIRIAPIYMFIMAAYGWILPYSGDGPLWKTRIGLESSRCVSSWWINLLFINNYVNVEDQCMVQSWYLACDMHFFIVGALLVYAVWKWPKAGEILLWFTLFLSCAIPSYITYVNRYWGIVPHYNSLFLDPVANEQFRNIYITSHNRFGPYMIGIISAYILHKLQSRNFKFSIPIMIIGSIIAASLSMGSIMVGYLFYVRERPYDLMENVLYGGIHRTVFAIGIMFFIIAEATTGYGILYNVLKHPFFTAFGRLTYCAYLVHLIPQLIHASSSRLPLYLDLKRMFWYTMGDCVMTYLLALGLNLLFEAPLERLQKKVINTLLKKHDSKGKLRQERKFNGELTEVGVDNPAMDKADIA